MADATSPGGSASTASRCCAVTRASSAAASQSGNRELTIPLGPHAIAQQPIAVSKSVNAFAVTLAETRKPGLEFAL
jgi:hypothetical protein